MGATVDAASKNGFTPLVFAAIKDDVASIKTLLAAGADPNRAVQSGARPLIIAMQYSTRRRRWRCSTAAPTSTCAIAAATRRCIWRRRPAI